jgi:uncharacterized protein with GYD domain
MVTYIVLATMTDQGVRSVKNLPRRLANADETVTAFGGKIKDLYLAMGPYDYVVVVEASDDEAMARGVLTIGSQGNVRTQTFRVFDREETLRLSEGIG